MILVTGATGNIGQELVRQLAEGGAQVCALIRDQSRASEFESPGVNFAVGDLANPDSLDAALVGVDQAFLLSATDPRQVELQANFIDAAKRAGVSHLVKISVVGAAPDAPAKLMRWHAETEDYLAKSGVPYTNLRPHVFYQYYLYLAPMVLGTGGFTASLKPEVQLASIDIRDIAASAKSIFANPAPHRGQTYFLTGPYAFSNAELAQKIGALIGKPVSYTWSPGDESRRVMQEMGFAEWMADVVTEMDEAYSTGRYGYTTDAVKQITGQEPRSVDQYLEEFAFVFAGGDEG
jgi:uncharacterized protein YbjT (DUF2867 family)